MKRICLFIALLILSVTVCFAGDIQVSCEAGLRIYLDGEFIGTSSAKEDGFFLMNVDRGEHAVSVEKDGFITQRFEVEILDLPIEVNVAAFMPVLAPPKEEPPEPARVHQRVGNLVVTSAPQKCVVKIDGRVETKETPQLSIGGLSEGEHTISFSKPGFQDISGKVVIQPGTEIRVRGNLYDGSVEVVHEGQGSLMVMSKPQYCKVLFREKIYDKTNMKLKISKIPAGEHLLAARWKGMERSRKIWIKKGHRTIVTIDFMGGEQAFFVSYESE